MQLPAVLLELIESNLLPKEHRLARFCRLKKLSSVDPRERKTWLPSHTEVDALIPNLPILTKGILMILPTVDQVS
jgi:hypothetical protein